MEDVDAVVPQLEGHFKSLWMTDHLIWQDYFAYEIMTNTLFSSPLHKNYGSIIGQQRFSPPGFIMSLGLKDVKLALDASEAKSTPMPIASLVHDQFQSGIARGYGELDWAALALVIAENAGLPKKGE